VFETREMMPSAMMPYSFEQVRRIFYFTSCSMLQYQRGANALPELLVRESEDRAIHNIVVAHQDCFDVVC